MTDRRSRRPPFEHLNLRRNPFGELNRETRGRIAVVDLEPMLASLQAETVVQLTGPPGSGKSTVLHALEADLEEVAYRRVRREGRIEEWPEPDVLLVDEIQWLDRSRRLELWRGRPRLAVATHTDFTDEIETAGRTVTTFDLGAGSGVDELAAMIRRRIEAQRRDEGPVPTLTRSAVRELRERYGANHRRMEDHLYEILQRLEEPRAIVPADLDAIDPPAPAASH